MYTKPAGFGKVRITVGDNLYEFKLPEPLYSIYMDLIVSIESGEVTTHIGDSARHYLHTRLMDWWTEKMPHVEVDKFNKALEQSMEYDLPHHHRLRC